MIKTRIRYFSYLPISTTFDTISKPKYAEKTFFIPLVLVFLIVNSAFLFAGLYLKQLNSAFIFPNWFLPVDVPISVGTALLLSLLFAVSHCLAFLYLAYKRETTYFKYHAFGIDIDGVLSDQTSRFVTYYNKLLTESAIENELRSGNAIVESDIKQIPVHLNDGLGIRQDDERIIFNTKEYWEGLKTKTGAVKRVIEFQKSFGYRIFFFSYRDWPQYPDNKSDAGLMRSRIEGASGTPLEAGDMKKITKNWLKAIGLRNVYVVTGFWSDLIYTFGGRFFRSRFPFVALSSSIKLTLEKGNPYISDTRFRRNNILARNRFQAARSVGFRFFIEDVPENAIKLSSLCDYVFMFDEPYNVRSHHNLPKNVIRVKSWDDIYRQLKILN